MKRFMPFCTLAAAAVFAVSASAQDTTVKTKTDIDADDAKVMLVEGCLQAGEEPGTFVLANVKAVKAGEELESETKAEVDVDEDETEVETETEAEVERDDDDKAVGTAGIVAAYRLTPRAGVNLAPHVGHRVQISAVALEPKDGDDDAEVDIQTEVKTEREDAPDSKVKTETEAELPRGAHARLTAVAVKHISPSCSQ
jgi:hypothetical protein